MALKRLRIRNYKSLRDVTFEPSSFACLVGANASGKTNLADCIDFLSKVYAHGLEQAIVMKGGLENILYRGKEGLSSSLEVEVTLETKNTIQINNIFRSLNLTIIEEEPRRYSIKHNFGLATSHPTREQYKVTSESINVQLNDAPKLALVFPHDEVETSRLAHPKEVIREQNFPTFFFAPYPSYYGKQNLWLNSNRLHQSDFDGFISTASNMHVYAFSPYLSRQSGVPTPNPILKRNGEQLPALVQWLRREHPQAWAGVMESMQEILPELTDIQPVSLFNKTLGLSFHEGGLEGGWTGDEVSDGTIQALATLCAAADPRNTLLLIEELENSVHPWILRVLVKRLKEVSSRKNVILTTHSPILVNLLEPEKIWVVSRRGGETTVQRLTDIAPNVREDWEEGKYQLYDLLDSGSIGQAVPGGVI